jgi:hypothetical protein
MGCDIDSRLVLYTRDRCEKHDLPGIIRRNNPWSVHHFEGETRGGWLGSQPEGQAPGSTRPPQAGGIALRARPQPPRAPKILGRQGFSPHRLGAAFFGAGLVPTPGAAWGLPSGPGL